MLSIVNVVGSAIAKASDDVIYTWAGPEIAVATTKAYSTQLTVIYLIAAYMADKLGKISKKKNMQTLLKKLSHFRIRLLKFLNLKKMFSILPQSSIIAIQYSLSAETLTMQYLLKAH